MNQLNYIRLDRNYRKSLVNTDIRNLGIGVVGMILFSSFTLNWALRTMDHPAVFILYLICFSVAQFFYIRPLIMVYEGGYVSVFKKYKNVPINKRLFLRSKLLLLTRFSVFFCLPVQLFHFWGLNRTDTPHLGIVGFWPLTSMLITLFVQFIFISILARDFQK